MNHPYEDMVAALFDAFVQGRTAKPVLPAGRREEVISALDRLMADPDLLSAYAAALEAERARRGDDVEARLLSLAGENIPDAAIAADGFAGLSDDQLADFALSPEALRAISEFLEDPETEPGGWYWDRVLQVEGARPGAEERDHDVQPRRLKAKHQEQPQFPEDQLLADALVESFIEGGMEKPVLPEGMRDEYVALLYRLLADGDRFDAYLAHLEAAQERGGVVNVILDLPTNGFPEESVVSGSFADYSNDLLADIAISLSGLEALRDYLDDPETPVHPWYMEALLKVERERPDTPRKYLRTRKLETYLRDLGRSEG